MIYSREFQRDQALPIFQSALTSTTSTSSSAPSDGYKRKRIRQKDQFTSSEDQRPNCSRTTLAPNIRTTKCWKEDCWTHWKGQYSSSYGSQWQDDGTAEICSQ
ncbi:hypothetical protein L5515_001951 [Caenorhabditis briggsae]|uniref:Uncharacterized protein n=1 Tax=Caenorhabditis briggsae TaxID=6238 RepID=A0AAE9E670_CAEBR|nr:hypothetical protein L5515_001951 [Caenorhabditis briggsae]